jgi:hypothetical protein
MRVHILCQNYEEDRIIPRMARALRDSLGWSVGASPAPADVLYLSGYFEWNRVGPRRPKGKIAAYFTHREEQPPNNAKAKLFDKVAEEVDLRIATCRMYASDLETYGPTAQMPAPLEFDRFVPAASRRAGKPVVGFSGYTYANHRKGETLASGLVSGAVGQRVEWRASGRGWPVATKRYSWASMPSFYQGLDILVVPSLVEGIPMPPLEALACGVKVVIPRGVGLLDELPVIPGIERFDRGSLASMEAALERALQTEADPEQLREAVAGHGVAAWCRAHEAAFEAAFGAPAVAPIAQPAPSAAPRRAPLGSRGVYCVAFGDPARESATRMMTSCKRFMPDVPIALAGASPLGIEDVFIEQPDSDVGGRRAKLRAYELAPAEWQAVLYLDADTELIGPIHRYFEWVEDGWQLVITKDPHLMDTMWSYQRHNNLAEMKELQASVKTLDTLQLNGGVWAFGRDPEVEAFFGRWLAQWEKTGQRDQGPLVKALYAAPLRMLVLGNEWNTFEKYSVGIQSAGLMHYPGDARRWHGMIPGRIDSAEAWRHVDRFGRRSRK